MGAAGILTVDYVAMYVASALIMIPIGIYGSITQARHIAHFLSIQNITSFKNNTSTRIIILDSVCILILGVVYVMGWILIALPIVALITAFLLWRIQPMYVGLKHRMYQKMFKEG
jgi:ABC-type bacteriocin/lantibiotic exporter with double-glycine peptidase domain